MFCCARGSTTYILVRTTAVLLFAAVTYRYSIRTIKKINGKQNQDLPYKMLEDMVVLANSACLLASVVVWHVRKRKHGTARHRTALRRAVELAKLNGAGDTAV